MVEYLVVHDELPCMRYCTLYFAAHETMFQFTVAVVEVIPEVEKPVTLSQAITSRFEPLSVPVTTGPLLVTRMRYFVPDLGFDAMVALMVPELAVLLRVPMEVGDAKFHFLSESSAV